MPTFVYIVMERYYEETYSVAVFWTKEAAKAHVDSLNGDEWCFEIVKMEVKGDRQNPASHP
jgi:hypothetical protein